MRSNKAGFTMVELIVVIVVIGILSTLAAVRFVDRVSVDVPAFAQQVRGMIRYGQKLAIAQNRPVFVSGTSNRVALCFDASCTQKVTAPGSGNSGSSESQAACNNSTWYCEGVPSGVVLGTTGWTMFFDQQGRPFAGADSIGTDISNFATLSLVVTGGTISENITVEQETGYVH